MSTPLMRRCIAALLLVLLTACQSWRPTTVGPQGFAPREQPPSVRVTTTGGMVVTLQNPNVSNDSIAGSTEFGPARMAARDLRLLEVQRFDSMKTVGFVTLNAVVIVGFMALFIHVQPHYAF